MAARKRTESSDNPATGSSAPEIDRDLERAIGTQIRRFRQRQNLAISELASAAGITNGAMSKIENGQVSPSLSTLQAIAKALQTPLSTLFAQFDERADCSYVPSGKGVTIDRRGTKVGHVYQLLGALLRGDVAVEPYLITLTEDAAPYTSFQHAGVEFIYMLEGKITYRHGAQSYELRKGDALLFDSGALHGPETLSGGSVRYLSIIVYPRGSGA